MICRILAVLFLFFLSAPMQAQHKNILYVALSQSKGYVVGSKVAGVGFIRHERDTIWSSMGWKISRVNGIAFGLENSDYIFLACGNGAVRTLNGGKSWKIMTGWEVTEVQGIAIDPNVPENVYLASSYGIWRTNDKGENWTESSQGLRHTYTQVVRVDRNKPGYLIAGSEKGLNRSTDGAKNWVPVGPDDVAVRDIQQSASEPDLWLAATGGAGVWISNNGGATWIQAPGKISSETVYAVAIDPTNANRMAAAGWNTSVYLSSDGGKNWKPYSKGLPVKNISRLVFDPDHSGRLWAGTIESGLYYTDDFGKSWTYAGLNGAYIFDLVFAEANNDKG